MTYTQVTFLISPAIPWRDILMVELTDLGYEGFEDGFTDPIGPSGELKAYIPEDQFSAAALSGLLTLRDPHASVSWTTENIAPRNWNAEWESSFQPVEVGKEVLIRADFHAAVPGFTHDLVVTSADSAEVGSIVTIDGVLAAEKDFGAGYKYDAIVEDAKIIK